MSDSEEECNEKQLKVVILGEQNVGKTNLIKKFCCDEFSRVYVPTIGADFFIKRITLSGSKEIIVRITDVSGLELNGHMLETYLFKANMVIMVYDITNSESFDSLAVWLGKIDDAINHKVEERSLFIAVLGNKCDLEHKRAVRLDITNHFIHDNKLLNFFVSAKTGESVSSTFMELIARYFNITLTNIEREKQRPVLKAEIIPITPPVVQTKSKSYKSKNTKKAARKINKKSIQTCIIQ